MVPFKVNLEGQIAAVTGGGGVLCSEMSRALAECGAKVAVMNRNIETASAVAGEINKAGGTAIGISIDVLKPESMEKAVEIIKKEWNGGVDILINGAGGNHPKGTTGAEYLEKDYFEKSGEKLSTFFELEKEGMEFVFNINLLGTMFASQIFSKDMVKKGKGSIINISSMAAYSPLTKVAAYSGAKAAVNNFTQWLAVHFSRTGVRVNAIAPGFFLTEQNRSLLQNEDGTPTTRSTKILNNIPMGHYGDPSDLTGAVLWLADSRSSKYVTGIIVPVDGGFSAYSGV